MKSERGLTCSSFHFPDYLGRLIVDYGNQPKLKHHKNTSNYHQLKLFNNNSNNNNNNDKIKVVFTPLHIVINYTCTVYCVHVDKNITTKGFHVDVIFFFSYQLQQCILVSPMGKYVL